MNTIKGVSPKGRAITLGAAAIAVGLAISPTSLAQSVLDLPDPAGNTIQVNAGGDQVQPQFALWPLTGPNNSNIVYESNDATGRGANVTGPIAGNIIQISTGGNVANPQVALFTNNNSNIQTYGNWAKGNGSPKSVTGGQVLGNIVDANGNVFQMEFLQGNVINPQFAYMGDNTSNIVTAGNYAEGNGGSTTGALAFVDAQGNVVQVMILSHNVINPQVSVGGSNTLNITSAGNTAIDNGGSVQATGFSGIFSVTQVGNVTQIAILSNNVWAPQLVLPGPNGLGGTNTGHIVTDTNDAEVDGTTINLPPGNPPPGRIDQGNIFQWAPFGNGNIDNPQWNFANHATPAPVVQEDENNDSPPPEQLSSSNLPEGGGPNDDGSGPPAPKIRPSLFFQPGGGDNKNNGGGGNSSVNSNWKPGDGVKAVASAVKNAVNDIKKALTPEKKESAPAG